ncbi:hypothetical protein SAMN05216266_101785 [Amycolatopsis marina]|uniref:Uncharacterized protein n=1 Tax=Amycolatopsis marina TaxID=490629 RepID=A0A1I0W688_9PSEU|nr:hypothetical protein [Amycolatopsis marina]SFA84255.1 hypothetical protein SAMN05216266_101785 [Amycolatopsis marina]
MNEEFAPHLAALRRCVDAGFQFQQLPEGLSGTRTRLATIEVLLVRDTHDCVAARYRLDDLERPRPHALWSAMGTVAEVVNGLLSLPPHGEPGAPRLALECPDVPRQL